MTNTLHGARVCLEHALADEWNELPLSEREYAKLADEIMFAKSFIKEAEARLQEISND